MRYDEYKKYKSIDEFIDAAIEADIESGKFMTIDDILSKKHMNKRQVLKKVNEFRKHFFELLELKGIKSRNITKICCQLLNLSENDKSNTARFLCIAMLTEQGLLFDKSFNSDDKIWLWYDQLNDIRGLTELVEREHDLKNRFEQIKTHKPNTKNTEVNDKEQRSLFNIAVKHKFLKKYKDSNIFLENIAELVRMVNSDKVYRQIKPYVYFAVLTHKKRPMTRRSGYQPNIQSIFDYQQYNIYDDNGKNFNTYEDYTLLYSDLVEKFNDNETDIELSDYCMANFSNLCEWYYKNCERDEDMPISLKGALNLAAGRFSCVSMSYWLSEEWIIKYDFDDESPDPTDAYEELIYDYEFVQDFVSAVCKNENNIDVYAEKVYDATKDKIKNISSSKEQAVLLAKRCLLECLQYYNSNILALAVHNF